MKLLAVDFSSVLTELMMFFFFFQAEDGIRDLTVTGVQTCALPISSSIEDRVYPGEGTATIGLRVQKRFKPAKYECTRSRSAGLRRGIVALCGSLATDRKSTRLNSSHSQISYAVFCLKKKNNQTCDIPARHVERRAAAVHARVEVQPERARTLARDKRLVH